MFDSIQRIVQLYIVGGFHFPWVDLSWLRSLALSPAAVLAPPRWEMLACDWCPAASFFLGDLLEWYCDVLRFSFRKFFFVDYFAFIWRTTSFESLLAILPPATSGILYCGWEPRISYVHCISSVWMTILPILALPYSVGVKDTMKFVPSLP